MLNSAAKWVSLALDIDPTMPLQLTLSVAAWFPCYHPVLSVLLKFGAHLRLVKW